MPKFAKALLALATMVASAFAFSQADDAHDARYYRRQAMAAYKAKDYNSALANLTKAAELIPDHPSIIYGIASLHALLGHQSEAIAWLNRIADMGLALHPDRDEDFNSLKESPGFKAIVQRFDANASPVSHSTAEFTLPETGLVTEGIAYDPVEQTFYISSVHRRKIVSRDRNGVVRTLASRQDGLWSVLGMKVDARRRLLWATTTAFPQMENYSKELEGSSAVLKFDLRTKKLLKKYPVPDTGKKHALGDLTVNSQGDVFTSDSATPAIYVIRHDRDRIETWIDGASLFYSPQGLAFSDDERHLFMADYGKGVFEIDANSGRVVRLEPAPGSTSLGIDGLYFHRGSLIGVQNGVTPQRVVRLILGANRRRIDKLEVLEANNASFDEPTLGVFVKDDFYFIANSQWGSVDEKGRLAAAERLKQPLILKMNLSH